MATAVGAGLSALTPSAAPARLTGRFWSIDPAAWKAEGRDAFPEDAALKGRPDFGIAFSGGGTRAAAATIGQLRGLSSNGWLAKVKYVAAVSGGSWSVVPFVFADRPLPDLLGPSLAVGKLTKAELEKEPPVGSLARSVVRSKLGAHSAVEAAEFVARRRAEREDAPAVLRLLVDRVIRGGTDRTFADLLRRVFLDPVLAKDSRLRYAWDDASVTDFVDGNGTLSYGDFVRAAPQRPFPIIGGTIIATHPAYEYPVLIPLELTPLYSGVRQRFGPRLGSIYVRPFVYGTVADVIVNDRVAVTDGTTPFTLADTIAISGAAPLLTLYPGPAAPAAEAGRPVLPDVQAVHRRRQEPGGAGRDVVARRRRVHRQPRADAAPRAAGAQRHRVRERQGRDREERDHRVALPKAAAADRLRRPVQQQGLRRAEIPGASQRSRDGGEDEGQPSTAIEAGAFEATRSTTSAPTRG